MKFIIALLCLTAMSFGQTYRTVTANTNDVIRTNFTMAVAQVSGAMTTNGSAAGLTNFPASLLRTNGDGSGLTNLPNANLTNATGILPISNGGTGATNASLAISNLLPSYTGNSNRILALNSNATALQWTTNSGGGGGLTNINLSGTNVTGILAVTNGGTSGTNTRTAILGLGILNTNNYSVNLFYDGTNADSAHIVIGAFASAYSTNFGDTAVVIGTSAQGSNGGVSVGSYTIAQSGVTIGDNAQSEGRGVSIGGNAVASGGSIDDFSIFGGVAIGHDASSDTNNGVAVGATAGVEGNGAAIGWGTDARGGTNGGVAIGYFADSYEGIAIGVNAEANNGVAIGANANDDNEGVAIGIRASTVNGAAIGIDAVSDVGYQIGTGTNNGTNSLQFLNAGEVSTNEWTRIAGLSTYPNTNIQITKVGGVTNTLVFSNGILVNVTTP